MFFTGCGSEFGTLLDDYKNKVYWCEYGDQPGKGAIKFADLNGKNKYTIVSGLDNVTDLAIDIESEKVFWVQNYPSKGDLIAWSKLDGTGRGSYDTGSITNGPYGIALDTKSAKVYWTDTEARTIFQADYNVSGATPWVTAAGTEAWDIEIDSDANYIYFSLNAGTSIIRVPLNSTSASPTSFIGRLNPINGIAIDKKNNKIYWVETGNIIRANLSDGTNIESVYTGGSAYEIALDVKNNRVYFTTKTVGTIYYKDIDIGSTATAEVFLDGLDNPYGIVVVN